MAVLIVAALVCGGGYLASLKIWPETKCGRCDGSGRNRGSTSKRFGKCKRCAGTGRKPRLGTRMLDRRGRLATRTPNVEPHPRPGPPPPEGGGPCSLSGAPRRNQAGGD